MASRAARRAASSLFALRTTDTATPSRRRHCGLICRRPEYYPALLAVATPHLVKRAFPQCKGAVRRFEVHGAVCTGLGMLISTLAAIR